MANDKSLGDYFQDVSQRLATEAVSLIDFDELSKQLTQAQQVLNSVSQQTEELTTLRRDYEERIAGMAKAIAASEPRKEMSEELLLLCASLETLPTPELLKQYRRVSAKFRDAFPSSFGLLRMTSGGMKKQQYTDYK